MPNNWKIYKLGDIASVQTGPFGSQLHQKDYVLDGTPILTVEHLGNNRIVHQNLPRVNDYDKNRLKKYCIQKGDIVFSRVGSVDRRAFVTEKEDGWLFSGRCLRVRADEKNVDGSFLSYYFGQESFKDLIRRIAVGATMPSLNTSILSSIEISIPENLLEQQSIASILSAIDDKIENNLAINKTLEEMAMALYKHWFVDFGPFKDGEFVESELGLIPKGWEVKKIGDLVTVLGGYAFKSAWFKDEGVKVLKIKNINNNIVDLNNCTCISEEISKTINTKFKVVKGDFLIAMTGAEVGKVGAVPDYNQDLWLNQRVGKIVDKEIQNASVLIGKLLQTDDFYNAVQGLAYGSAQPNISTSDIESIKIILPKDFTVLKEIIDEFVISHNITIQNLTENQYLTQLRDTLLPKLISGEVRLKEFRE